MKTKFTIPSKFRPSFKVLVGIIVVLFFSPFIGVWINYSTSLYICDLYTFGISDRKDFFTVWIALFGAIGIAFNIYQNQKRTVNQDRQLENQYKQLQNQEEQLNEQEKQIALQSKSQRDSRFSKGIELLGNDNESARTGAAYSLCFLAKEKDCQKEFSQPVFDILCSHIRTLTTSEEYLKKHPTVSNEAQTILDLLFKDIDGNNTAPFYTYKADLREVHLEGADLTLAHLEEAELTLAHLQEAYLVETHLERAYFGRTHLEGAYLIRTHLAGAYLGEEDHLKGAYISLSIVPFLKEKGVDLSDVTGIDENINDTKKSPFVPIL